MADTLSRINLMRSLYQAQTPSSSSEVVRALNEIKNEIRITNEENARDNKKINSATGSPYLPDQDFYKKETVYNSPQETEWKNVPTAEDVERGTEEKFIESNKKKLNII